MGSTRRTIDDVKTRILRLSDIIGECWVWKGNINDTGYGKINIRRKPYLAHRISYEVFIGEIHEGLQINHTCQNRACINPDHLEVITIKERNRRGNGIAAQHLRQTHCKRGHPLSGDNLLIHKSGSRECRACILLDERKIQRILYIKIHRIEIQKRQRLYRQTPTGKLKSSNEGHNRRARIKGKVTLDEWNTIKVNQKYRCYWCKERFKEKELSMDHVIPLSKGGLHEVSNIVAACKSCNSSKNNRIWSLV